MKREITYLDVCSGIGTAHYALKNLGCTSLGFCEINPKAEEVYRFLWKKDNLKNYGDVMSLNLKEVPFCDLIVAGFPCQSFSIAGKRNSLKDTRGQVIFGLLKLLREKKPKTFLFENVKGLVSIDEGKTFESILNHLEEEGYTVYWKVLNSLDFAIPQMRERVYIVGFRKDLGVTSFSFPKGIQRDLNFPLYLCNRDPQYEVQGSSLETFLRYLKNKYNKEENYSLESFLREDYLVLDTRQSDLRLYRNKVPTLRHGRQGILYIRDSKLRQLSPKEAFLLQGFSQDKVEGIDKHFSKTTLVSLVGNAMTVPVIQEISQEIIHVLEGKE